MMNTLPIRVLQVVTNMDRGGLETMLMNYYRNIDRDKVQFDFLTHRAEKAAYDDEILSLGGKIYHLPRLVPWSKSYKAALDSFFKEHGEYKIIHVHQDCLSSAALKEAEKCGVPVRIAHSHNANQDKDIKYPIKLFYMRYIPKYATDLLACSRAAGQWMFRGAEFSVLPNAIDAKAFSYNEQKRHEMRKELGLDENAFVIGHVGRFMPQKNHEFLIDIFAEIAKKVLEARLLLVGEGPLMQSVAEKAKRLMIENKVILTGVRSDVNNVLQAMDAFALPSRYEGLGIVAVEAQAAGLPCVISDKVPDECIITRGLVSAVPLSASPEQWARHIIGLCGTPRVDRYDEIAAAGYDIVSGAKKLERFYLEKASHV